MGFTFSNTWTIQNSARSHSRSVSPASKSSRSSSKAGHQTSPVLSSTVMKHCDRLGKYLTRTAGLVWEVNDILQVALYQGLGGDLDDSVFGAVSPSLKRRVKSMSAGALQWHQTLFDYMRSNAPAVLDLVQTPDAQDELDACIDKIRNRINTTRSNDFNPVRARISFYASPNMNEPLKPYLTNHSGRDEYGFNHRQLGRLLCPIPYIQDWRENRKRTQAKLLAGSIPGISTLLPAFTYKGDAVAGSEYDPENIAEGMWEGYMMERIAKHIFVAPKAGLNNDVTPVSTRSNAVIMDTTEIIPEHLPYITIVGRWGICAGKQWGETADGAYQWKKAHRHLLEIVWDPVYEDVVNKAVRYLNLQVFGHEDGANPESVDDDDDESNDKNMFTQLRAQLERKKAVAAQEEKDSESNTAETDIRARTVDITLEKDQDQFDSALEFDQATEDIEKGRDKTPQFSDSEQPPSKPPSKPPRKRRTIPSPSHSGEDNIDADASTTNTRNRQILPPRKDVVPNVDDTQPATSTRHQGHSDRHSEPVEGEPNNGEQLDEAAGTSTAVPARLRRPQASADLTFADEALSDAEDAENAEASRKTVTTRSKLVASAKTTGVTARKKRN
ncbi:hypothetical protein CONPUDRAFT_166086 [Coniophora puteana RWD-64-598 SS2]|uniref:Uncharacterized protein n=1 Tax=Coniophora puteana (strain RWD-64-598) TaxID=741705 RepID=A0A5M3MPG1_CONPW|nr:uncharacterized protein CONPUDRAFT_166086 [Coniophora puteana RWD-64-598 SS2]EIW80604.1 hypothetical protein CONPUDRAFT_166086 [Coniophora puteana RWD-64-598 SS2]